MQRRHARARHPATCLKASARQSLHAGKRSRACVVLSFMNSICRTTWRAASSASRGVDDGSSGACATASGVGRATFDLRLAGGLLLGSGASGTAACAAAGCCCQLGGLEGRGCRLGTGAEATDRARGQSSLAAALAAPAPLLPLMALAGEPSSGCLAGVTATSADAAPGAASGQAGCSSWGAAPRARDRRLQA